MAKIVGNVVGLPNPQPDWNQKDERKADYIKNKPNYENKFSNVLKGKANAVNALRIDDISPIPHNIDVKISKKNFLDLTAILGAEKTDGTATIKCLADGGITGNGTPTKAIGFSREETRFAEFEYDVFYTFSVSGEFTGIRGDITLLDENKNKVAEYTVTSSNREKTFTIPSEVKTISTTILRQSNSVEITGTAYFQIEKGTVATPYTQYVEDISETKLYRTGKNISGFIYSANYKDNWTPLQDGDKTRYCYDLTLPNTTMTINIGDNSLGTVALQKSVNGGTWERIAHILTSDATSNRPITFTKTPDTKYRVWCTVAGAQSITDIQVELGSTATEIEPYTEPIEVDKDNVISLYPTTTLISNTNGVLIEVEYNRDINKAFEEIYNAIISMGGNV